MVREILMNTLLSFGSIGQKLTKFCLFQFCVALVGRKGRVRTHIKARSKTATTRGKITTIAAVSLAGVAPWLIYCLYQYY